jgi:hypothetical protein
LICASLSCAWPTAGKNMAAASAAALVNSFTIAIPQNSMICYGVATGAVQFLVVMTVFE